MDWTALAVIGGFVINAIVVAYGYGGMHQRVRTLERDHSLNSNQINNNRKEIEDKLDTKSHVMLEECRITFSGLNTGISEIKGKVDMLAALILDGKK